MQDHQVKPNMHLYYSYHKKLIPDYNFRNNFHVFVKMCLSFKGIVDAFVDF